MNFCSGNTIQDNGKTKLFNASTTLLYFSVS